MFGRRGRKAGQDVPEQDPVLETSGPHTIGPDEPGPDEGAEDGAELGPYDENGPTIAGAQIDLGSLLVPLPTGGQIQVEMEPAGALRSVHLLTPFGRLTPAAFAAPRSAGLWREVAGELAAQMRSDQAQVSVADGPWGREVTGVGAKSTMTFIGVDGPRWMVRCVCAGPAETSAQLVELARAVLRRSVVKRGSDPLPVRTPLPVVLPEAVTAQLEQAKQAAAAQAAARAEQKPTDAAGQVEGGPSAVQQLPTDQDAAAGTGLDQPGTDRGSPA